MRGALLVDGVPVKRLLRLEEDNIVTAAFGRSSPGIL
jgi:hypothetical protein